jgi:NAD(P)H dehydrogenase (quinone)
MAERVFIWSANPKRGSLSEGLARAYKTGVLGKGAQVRHMNLSEMSFDMGALKSYGKGMPDLEADLVEFQENLAWADHLVLIHPLWWGSLPAQAKAVLDRTLLPGFAFKFHRKGQGWDKLLAGRTADVVVTADTPSWLDSILYLASWRRIVKKQILGFVGIKTRRISHISPIRSASKNQIEAWMQKMRKWGGEVANGKSKPENSKLRTA